MNEELRAMMEAAAPPASSPPAQTQVFVVPAELWGEIVKQLGKRKWSQVSALMPHVMAVQSQMAKVNPAKE